MDQKRFAAEPDEWILDAWFTDQEDSLLNGTVTLPLASYLTASGALEMAEAADRLIGWATAMKLRALARVEQAMGEEWHGRREEQPERLGGEETHALAVAEVATACAVSENAAARLLHDAADLAALGGSQWEVLEALEDGQVSPAHLRVILDASRTVPAECAEKFSRAALQRLSTRTGRRRTPSELRACLRKLREKMHPEPLEARTKAARRERGVWFAPDPDGMCTLTAHLPAEAGLAIYTGLDRAARAAKSHAVPNYAEPNHAVPNHAEPNHAVPNAAPNNAAPNFPAANGAALPYPAALSSASDPSVVSPAITRAAEERTLNELRADALVERFLGSPGASSDGLGNGLGDGRDAHSGEGTGALPFRPEIVVTIPIGLALGADQAAGTAGAHQAAGSGNAANAGNTGNAANAAIDAGMLASAELEGYGPIDAATARRLAALAPTWFRLFTDPVTGRALGVGRTAYRPPQALRRYLAHRDGGCAFPGCTHPVRGCEPDHTIEWQHGGGTDPGNLALLCRKHHALKSIGAWTYTHVNTNTQPPTGTGTDTDTDTDDSGHGHLIWRSPLGRTHTTEPNDELQPVRPLTPPQDPPPPYPQNTPPPGPLSTAPPDPLNTPPPNPQPPPF
ncbi:DUF222 domain-containing protein [Sinomonas sp. G460-2]|uniref:HNH endonuclease signature motif containing protein n=1 Tax=Sinomonas sp. G460-2 TaxID=3393464 RepID=UPI0039EDEBD6